MKFEEFLLRLPDCAGPDSLPLVNNPGGFRYIVEGLPEFVGPDVSAISSVDQPDKPNVVIISAAGAVGKSTLANEAANRKKAPFYDLAQASAVGENSMTGQLSTSFGFKAAGHVSAALKSGKLFVIVDALDEARVKANEAGFEAFIRDIAGIAKDADGIAFVLLGRTQTAETTWLLLDDVGVKASLIAIQPFTREQAEQYIEARIQHFDNSAAARIAGHRQPFEQARDLILNHLERAVGSDVTSDDVAAREFLGYAPVLETVAVLLAKETNYQEFVAGLSSMQIGAENPTRRPLAILEHVVTRLLEREQTQKLQVNIRPALDKVASETGWSAWDTLYSPDEQRTRLLGHILGRHLKAGPEMPSAVRARYEEQLETWLREHPFLRDGREPANKVFESYLFAIAMREYLTPLSHIVEERLIVRGYKPSRLLADFYILLGEQRKEEVIAERQIGLLYDSLLAGETDALKVRLSIDSGDPDEDAEGESPTEGEGEFELVYTVGASADSERVETRNFKIVEGRGSIAFGRQLKDATVITRGEVVLGGGGDDFDIGPNVEVRCNRLKIVSPGFVVRGGAGKAKESDAVIMSAAACESRLLRKPVVRGALAVSWPTADAYPWNEFAIAIKNEDIDGQEMHEVHRRFRRIVYSLRSHSKGSLARFKDKIDHRRVLKNNIGRALLDALLRDGIMQLQGDFYHLIPERADELLKLSWLALRNRQITPEMKAYFSRFISENQKLFEKSEKLPN